MNSASAYRADVTFLSHLKEHQIYCTGLALAAQSEEKPGSRNVLNLAKRISGGRDHRVVAVGPSPFKVKFQRAEQKSQPRFVGISVSTSPAALGRGRWAARGSASLVSRSPALPLSVPLREPRTPPGAQGGGATLPAPASPPPPLAAQAALRRKGKEGGDDKSERPREARRA